MMVVLATLRTRVTQYSVEEGHEDRASFIELSLDRWICKLHVEVGKGSFHFKVKMQNK